MYVGSIGYIIFASPGLLHGKGREARGLAFVKGKFGKEDYRVPARSFSLFEKFRSILSMVRRRNSITLSKKKNAVKISISYCK